MKNKRWQAVVMITFASVMFALHPFVAVAAEKLTGCWTGSYEKRLKCYKREIKILKKRGGNAKQLQLLEENKVLIEKELKDIGFVEKRRAAQVEKERLQAEKEWRRRKEAEQAAEQAARRRARRILSTYQLGLKDGCNSSKAKSGAKNFKYKKRLNLYLSDTTYRMAWRDGFSECRR